MHSLNEFLIFHSVSIFGAFVRLLPLGIALFIGRMIGMLAYYFDTRHKILAYANLKMVFADSKSPAEIKCITKQLFRNYGQNFIDLFRMPLIKPENFHKLITVEGIENLSGPATGQRGHHAGHAFWQLGTGEPFVCHAAFAV